MPAKPPGKVMEAIIGVGQKKGHLSWHKLLVQGFNAGAFIAFGGLTSFVVAGGVPAMKSENPGLQKFLFASVFPVGLVAVILCGSELFTGNTMALWPAVGSFKLNIVRLFYNWVLSYIGNFFGSIFVAYFLAYYTDILAKDPWKSAIIGSAEGKCNQDWVVMFVKAIGCNWLVCLAVWQAIAAEEVAGKVLAIWFPIMAFVAIGFEHCVANMFIVPTGMFYGADVEWSDFVARNLFPVTLGNIVGGFGFMGVMFWYIFADKTEQPLLKPYYWAEKKIMEGYEKAKNSAVDSIKEQVSNAVKEEKDVETGKEMEEKNLVMESEDEK